MKIFIYALSILAIMSTKYVNAENEINNKNVATEMSTIVITGTRESKLKSDVAESIGVISSEEIQSTSPAHPSEILNRIPGVHINKTSGEGHMSSIRQPITTGGVYLFLEDGIPTRPSGFFNHNGLYEINLPQAERIEVIKGPGSALYGSDAIGGIINSITRVSPSNNELDVKVEHGEYRWKKALISAGAPLSEDTSFRLNLNLTDNEGWRDESQYTRSSNTLRFDTIFDGNITAKTIATYNVIDQSSTSSISESDYKNNPTTNYDHNDLGKREVEAMRISTEVSYEPNNKTLYSVIPFFRDNHMMLMPGWMLSYDPNIRDYNFQSYGALFKQREKFLNGELIIGVDIDYTESTYLEMDITTTKNGDIYTAYAYTGTLHYDYDANQTSISPYIHSEYNLSPRFKFTGGLRYDHFNVDYKNKLSTVTSGYKIRPASQDISWNHASPKLGLLYKINDKEMIYANYRHAFRTPSVNQLFRSGSTVNTTSLEPVETDSFEIGFRGQLMNWLNFDSSIYHMTKRNDIVSIIDDSDRKITNAGKTTHQGIELSLNGILTEQLKFSSAFTYTKQEYDTFSAIVSGTQRNYDGYDIAKAPKTIGNLTLTYSPKIFKNSSISLEWEHLGKYYVDETNTDEYNGHDLLNLRANYALDKNMDIYFRMMNVTNKLYSTYASKTVGSSAVKYRPGSPSVVLVGLNYSF